MCIDCIADQWRRGQAFCAGCDGRIAPWVKPAVADTPLAGKQPYHGGCVPWALGAILAGATYQGPDEEWAGFSAAAWRGG